jgi:hypothetical protein
VASCTEFEGVALENLSLTEVLSNVLQTMAQAQRASLFGKDKFLGELRAGESTELGVLLTSV